MGCDGYLKEKECFVNFICYTCGKPLYNGEDWTLKHSNCDKRDNDLRVNIETEGYEAR